MSTNELITEFAGFAKSIAINYKSKVPPFIALDELISAAYMGLVEAANRYNGSVPFKAYAQFRILGEIRDYLRKEPKASVILEDQCYVQKSNEFFQKVTKSLNSVGKSVILMRYQEGYSLKEISAKVALSEGRVSQILKENCNLIKNQYKLTELMEELT